MNNFSDLVGLIDQSLLGQSVKRMAEREEIRKKERIAEMRRKVKQYNRLARKWQAKLNEQINRNP